MESTILVAPLVEVEEEVSQVDLKALVTLNPSGTTLRFPYKFANASIWTLQMVILDDYRDVETFVGCQKGSVRKSEI